MNCLKCNKEHDGSFGSGKFCSRQCANSRNWSEEDNLKKSKSAINSPLVLKANRNKQIGHTTEKECPICKNKFTVPISESDQIFCSRKCCELDINFEFRKKPAGGYRRGAGRSKGGWYKGIWCDSSWELAWVIYNLDKGISFKRNTQGFEYNFKGEIHRYFPDFIMNDFFIEIKGILKEKDRYKIEQFPFKLKVLFKKDLKEVFNYVVKTYGGDFIKLYENNPHKIRSNKCLVCDKPAKKIYCSQKCAGIGVKKLYH